MATSPNTFISFKSKKHQHQTTVRHNVEKMLKKQRVTDMSLLSKVGAVALNHHFNIPSAKVGEVFSSIVSKNMGNRAAANLELAQMLRTSANHHHHHTKRKKRHLPSAK